MNVFDIILAVLALAAVIRGWHKGLVMQLGQLVALIVAIIASRLLGAQVVDWLVTRFGNGEPSLLATAGGYALTFVVVWTVVWLVARTLSGLVKALHLGIIDRLGGAALNVAEWLMVVSAVLTLWIALRPDDRQAIVGDSPWHEFVVDFAPKVVGALSQINLEEHPDVNIFEASGK